MATGHSQPTPQSTPTSSTQTPIPMGSPAESRDLYRQKYEAQLREWQAKVEEIRARSDKLGAQARLDMQPHLDKLRTHYDTAHSRFQDMGAAAEDKWEDVKVNAESAWNDFKSSIEGAYDALRSHGKSSKKS